MLILPDMSENSEKKNTKYYCYLKKCQICGLRNVNNVRMHRTPRNEVFRDKWIKATKKNLPCSSVICSNHFKSSDYRDCQIKKILKPGAVPSVHLDGGNIREAKNQTLSETSQRLGSSESFNLSDKQNVDSDSEELSSSQTYENNNSAEEICNIYYLDEKHNVRYYQTSDRHDSIESIYSESSDSNQIDNPSNFEASQIHHGIQNMMRHNQSVTITQKTKALGSLMFLNWPD